MTNLLTLFLGWDSSNSDYLITNSGRIATKVTQNISTLLSRGAQFSVDHIIEFKVSLEMGLIKNVRSLLLIIIHSFSFWKQRRVAVRKESD